MHFIVGIFITLQRCRLQMENIDKLIFVHKKWPYNPWISYLKHIDVAFACETKLDLMAKLEVEFEDQVNNEDSLDLHCAS